MPSTPSRTSPPPSPIQRALRFGLATVLALALGPAAIDAQRLDIEPGEVKERRARLCAELGDAGSGNGGTGGSGGTVFLFSATTPSIGVRFRQDHDFFYFTGNEDKNAAVAIEVPSCKAWLFLPPQTAREASRDGWNWLYQEGADAKWGFETIHPLHYFDEFIARRRISGPQTAFVRLSERDRIDQSRTDAALYFGRRLNNPWGGQPSEEAWRASQLRQRYPFFELQDVTTAVDELRMHKTPFEIEALRRNGRISAKAIERAIAATAPGRYEYELEAESTHEMIRNGAEHAAYAAIIGSGANGNIWHYNSNGDRLEDGELIVMDYGASLAYQTMDITRTWPVSGDFTPLQERAYRAVLEAEKAIIAAMKPGVTRAETRAIARAIFDKHGFPGHYPGGAGHFVGMAVHDVGDYSRPLEEGMVIAVEPIIEIPEENLHIRIEDTVLVTATGAENLSDTVPKEIDDVLALVGRDVRATPQPSGQ